MFAGTGSHNKRRNIPVPAELGSNVKIEPVPFQLVAWLCDVIFVKTSIRPLGWSRSNLKSTFTSVAAIEVSHLRPM